MAKDAGRTLRHLNQDVSRVVRALDAQDGALGKGCQQILARLVIAKIVELSGAPDIVGGVLILSAEILDPERNPLL